MGGRIGVQGTVLMTQDFSSSFRTVHVCQELIFITPHAQRERGKVIGRGVHIIGERAKRARHSQVCSIENRGYIYYVYIVRAIFVLITRKVGGA